MSPDKKIYKTYSKIKNLNYDLIQHQANNLLKKQLFEESSNKTNVTNFSSFLNLDIDDKESTLTYLRQKNILKNSI